MHELYDTEGEDLSACIGPGISCHAFEVGTEVADAFHKAGYTLDGIIYYDPTRHKNHIDLPRANAIQLEQFGLLDSQIEDCRICTYSQCEDFFSARRLGIKSGRILSGIMLVDK